MLNIILMELKFIKISESVISTKLYFNINSAIMCSIKHEKLFTQDVTNVTFIFETSPNTKPKDEHEGGHGILFPYRLKNVGGHVPRIPHLNAPMGTMVPQLTY